MMNLRETVVVLKIPPIQTINLEIIFVMESGPVQSWDCVKEQLDRRKIFHISMLKRTIPHNVQQILRIFFI